MIMTEPSADAEQNILQARTCDQAGDHAGALALLERAAKTDAAAMRLLGKRLAVGRDTPFSPEEGVKLLSRATELGDAEATEVMSALTGAGAWTPQSWPGALDLLQLAAERGSLDARRQLVLLTQGSDVPADAPDRWKRLRDSIVLESWIVPPLPRELRVSPKIWTVEKFASPEICDWLVDKARGRAKPALIFDGRQTGLDARRSNTSFGIDIVDSGMLTLLLRFRIMGATTVSVTHMEPPNVLHYTGGQEFVAHHDCLYGRSNDATRGEGDRLATFLLYLNDDFDGGELEFPRIGLRHRGGKGDAVFFSNMTSGKPDPLSLHAGLPVTRGEKWIFSQWIRERPTGAAYAEN